MEENTQTNWGDKKMEYYSKNKRDKEDSDFDEEVEEALKIQQKKLQRLREANLLDSDNEDNEEGLEKKSKTIVKRGKKFNIESSDEETPANKKGKLTNEENEENEQILKNLRINLEEAHDNLLPVIEILGSRAKIDNFEAYLKAKKDMHVLYSLYLAFFLNFKLKGKIPYHHPVVKKMLYIKSLLNNMSEVDEKLVGKIDSILKLIEQQANPEESNDESNHEDTTMLNKKTKRNKADILDVDLTIT
jgi:hypothetical protein